VRKVGRACAEVLAGVVLLIAGGADAYEQYSLDGISGNCADCHGSFRFNPYISPVDGSNWGDDLHDIHRRSAPGMLENDCDTCHGSSRFPVILDSSNGGNGLAPIACVGCHGREEDIGNDDLSRGRGAGLRQHHYVAGISHCAGCHLDADPFEYTPVGEDVLPSYYFTPDPSHPNKPTDPCNPAGEEDYAGNLDGLDNDGDDLYDAADIIDCPEPEPAILGPFTVSDVFATPDCFFEGGCTGEDFPVDWGVIRTFNYSSALTPGDEVIDIFIDGTWGGNSGYSGTAPVELYLEGIPVTECLIFEPCWDSASTVDWNGGAGFLLSDLGVDFSNPAVRALFEDGTAELSVIQNDLTSVNLSNLRLMVHVVPEPSRIAGIVAGSVMLLVLGRLRNRWQRPPT
jgi:hypothetical protein